MATRMMTRPYGDRIPSAAVNEAAVKRLEPTLEMRVVDRLPSSDAAAMRMRPRLGSNDSDAPARPPPGPAPSPWAAPLESPHGLSALVLGLGAAAAVLAGLALLSIAAVWASAMTWPAHAVLLLAGGYVIALGVACMAASQSPQHPPGPTRA